MDELRYENGGWSLQQYANDKLPNVLGLLKTNVVLKVMVKSSWKDAPVSFFQSIEKKTCLTNPEICLLR